MAITLSLPFFRQIGIRPTLVLNWLPLLLVLFLHSLSFSAKGENINQSQQTIFYVSPSGNDAWSGKLITANSSKTDGPFATLIRARDVVRQLKAQQRLQGPVTIYLRGGYYFLSEPFVLTVEDSGLPHAPISYAAYQNEKPVISGGKLIKSQWIAGANDIYHTQLPQKVDTSINSNQLFVNGERRYRARTPNKGTFTVHKIDEAAMNGRYNTPSNFFYAKHGDINPHWTNLNEVEVVALHFWVDAHLPIKSYNDSTDMITFDRSTRRRFTESFRGEVFARYFVDNVFEGLDESGEWYYNRQTNTLYYKPLKKEQPGKAQIIMPHLTALVRIEGKPEQNQFVEHISVKGLTFSHNQWKLAATDAGDAQSVNNLPGALQGRGIRNCHIQDCTFENLGTYALELKEGSTSNTIVGNEFAHIGAGGIKINGGEASSDTLFRTERNEISNNYLHHLGEIHHSGVGILSQHSAKNRIAHNTIHNLYYSGISVGWVWGYAPSVSMGNIIEYNHIHTIGQAMLNDMGAIYMLGNSPGTIVRNNLIHDVYARRYGGWGIYTDEGCSGVLIENNLVYRTTHGGYHHHFGKENTVRNNIFAFGQEGQIGRIRNEEHRGFSFENNIVYGEDSAVLNRNWDGNGYFFNKNLYFRKGDGILRFSNWSFGEWQKKGQDQHSLIADPLFIQPEKGDFGLKKESPAFSLGFKPFSLTNVGPTGQYKNKWRLKK